MSGLSNPPRLALDVGPCRCLSGSQTRSRATCGTTASLGSRVSCSRRLRASRCVCRRSGQDHLRRLASERTSLDCAFMIFVIRLSASGCALVLILSESRLGAVTRLVRSPLTDTVTSSLPTMPRSWTDSIATSGGMTTDPGEILPGMSGTLVLLNGARIAVEVVSCANVWLTSSAITSRCTLSVPTESGR